jgi:hypothetical protein
MIRDLVRQWLGLENLDGRLLTVERHFVTRRHPETGEPMETLADVPLEKRRELKSPLKGMSWQQRRNWLEMTDGGRKVSR